MFEEKNKVLQDHEVVSVRIQQLEEAITKACSEFPGLKIPTEANSAEKIQKLAATIRESK